MKKLLLFFSFVTFIPCTSDAQKGEFDQRYKIALESLKKGSYAKAQAEFYPLTSKKFDYPQSPYAMYFFGLACLKNNQPLETKLALRQLLERYQNFEKIEDVYFLMANSYFITSEYLEAIEYLQKIKSESFKKEVEEMEENYFSKIQKLDLMRSLYSAFPDNKIIALNFSDLLVKTSTERSDLELSDRIANRYGVKQNSQTASGSSFVNMVNTKRKENPNKGFLNVGVMFPFNVAEIDTDKRTKQNQYALDMYEGIKLAKSSLQKEGITINLYAFDVDNKSEAVTELLQNNLFNQMDLYIGPLHHETNKIIANYCNQNKVPLVNPLASNKELLNNQPYVYLARPSVEMKAAKVAIFAQNNCLSDSKNVAVFYSANKSDSVLAVTYANYIQNSGYQVVTLSKLPSGGTETMGSVIPNGKTTKLNHVFLVGSNKNLANSFIASYERKSNSAPIIVTGDAINYETISQSFLETRSIYILDLEYVDKSKEAVRNFQQLYLTKRMTIPSEYAFKGYDLLLFFGRMLGKGTTKYQKLINLKNYTEGFTLGGFDYTESNENQNVTILKFENNKLQPVKN